MSSWLTRTLFGWNLALFFLHTDALLLRLRLFTLLFSLRLLGWSDVGGIALHGFALSSLFPRTRLSRARGALRLRHARSRPATDERTVAVDADSLLEARFSSG